MGITILAEKQVTVPDFPRGGIAYGNVVPQDWRISEECPLAKPWPEHGFINQEVLSQLGKTVSNILWKRVLEPWSRTFSSPRFFSRFH